MFIKLLLVLCLITLGWKSLLEVDYTSQYLMYYGLTQKKIVSQNINHSLLLKEAKAIKMGKRGPKAGYKHSKETIAKMIASKKNSKRGPYNIELKLTLNMEQLRRDLIQDEGYITEIYLDEFGHKTFGVGHLIVDHNIEYGLPIGTPISKSRIDFILRSDITYAINDARFFFPEFIILPKEVQSIVVNMIFNLGYRRFTKFVEFIFYVNKGNWKRAADEMVNSAWYQQVPKRAKRLVSRMRRVKQC